MIDGYKKDIIITSGPLGGLGDVLNYSTLAERFTNAGHDVYYDESNHARNDEIMELVWKQNPYIIGPSEKKPNAGYIRQGRFYDVANRFPIGSIEAMERAHDLLPPYSLAPRIYYRPQPYRINLQECVLLDYAAISSNISSQGVAECQQKMGERFGSRQFYMVTFPEGVNRNKPPLQGPSLEMKSIYEYIDALASCYAWVGSEAGGQALAAAVRGEHDVYDLTARPEIVCVISPKTHNSRGYTYRGVDYRVTVYGNITGDYWNPIPEVEYERYQEQARVSVQQQHAAWKEQKAAETTA